MGKPTIVGENKESHIFSDKKDTLVVRQADAKALAVAINWAFENKSKLSAIGQAGHRLYQQKFSNEKIARQVKELLAGL